MAGKETLVLASASSSIRTWSITLPSSNSSETSHKRLTVSIPAKDSKAVQLSWSADGSELAVAMLGAGVQIQNARGQAVDVVAGGGRDEVNQVAFMGGRRYVVFAGSGKVVKMFDREKHSLGILLRAKAAITALGVSADDKRCAAGTESGEIIVHSIGHGTSTTLTSPFKEAVNQIVFSSNRKSYMYAISDDGTVAQWDVDKKRDPLQIWRNVHKGPVRGLALPSATTMCTVGLDKMLNIYDLSTNRVVQTFNANTGLTSCSVAEDHIYALGSISGSLLIYDAQKNETIAQMKSPTDTGPIHAVTFQPTKSNKPSTVSSVKMPSNATVTRPTTPPDRKTTSTEADHAKRISEVVEGPISKSRVTAMQHNEFMGMFSPVAASTKPVAERTRVSAATMAQTKSSSAAAPPPQPARGQRVADVRRSVVAGQPRSHHGSADKLAPSGGRMEHARTRIVSQPRTETHAIERTRATVTTTSISRSASITASSSQRSLASLTKEPPEPQPKIRKPLRAPSPPLESDSTSKMEELHLLGSTTYHDPVTDMFSPLAKRTSRVSARTSPPVSPTPLSRRSSQASPTGDHQQPPPPAPSSTVTSLWDRINAVTKKTAQARLSTTEGTPHLEPRSTLGSAESAMRARAKTPEIHDPPLSRTGITPHTKEPTRDDRSTHDSNILHSQSRHTRREAEAEPASSAERNPRSRTETPEQSSRARQPQPVNDSPLLSHRRSTPTMSPHLNHKPESATPRERPASTTARSIQAEPLDGLSPAIASAPRFREVSAGIDVSALRERLVQEGPKWVNQQQHHIPRADAAHSTATSASRSRVPSSSSAHSVPASTSAAPPHIPMDIKKSSTDAAAAGVSVQQPTFQHQMLENVINDCLDEFRIQLRADVQNVHLDMMRQFWFQKAEIEQLFAQYSPNETMLEELRQLRLENARLRGNY